MIGNEPCLSEKIGVYTGVLEEVKNNCNRVNDLIDLELKETTERLKQSRSLQEKVNREIMMFVKEKLACFENPAFNRSASDSSGAGSSEW